MLNKMVNVKNTVVDILANNPETRDNDITLYFKVLDKMYGLRDAIGDVAHKQLMEVVHNAAPPESIRRARQRIQEQGFFLGTKRGARLKLADEVRGNIHNL